MFGKSHLKCSLAFAAWVLLKAASVCSGQEFIADPKFSIEGPAGQVVIVTIHYFDGDKVVQSVDRREKIQNEIERVDLEVGYSGFQVLLSSPTRAPVTLKLWDGEGLLQQKTSTSRSVSSIAIGTAKNHELPPPDPIRLEKREADFVRKALKAFSAADTANLVSRKRFANIDWPTLDSFCTSLHENFGPTELDQDELDGWLSWQGSMGVKVYGGPMRFKSGQCYLTLMANGDQLVDVLFDSSKLPDLWFAGPAKNTPYVAQANALTRLMFLGQIQQAHSLFSARFGDDVTPEVLSKLHQELKREFNSIATNLEFKTAILGDYDAAGESRTLRIVHAFDVGNQRCLSFTDFNFLCNEEKIGRGDLAGINFKQTWQSSRPNLAKLAKRLLPMISVGSSLADFEPMMRDDVVRKLDAKKFNEITKSMNAVTGKLESLPDWDLWRADGPASMVFAEGQVEFANGTFNLHIDFADDSLIGYALTGPYNAANTSLAIKNQEYFKDAGSRFWKSALKGDAEAAYEMLSPSFHQQLSLEKFTQLINNSELASNESVNISFVGARLSDRLDRPYPATITAYFQAERDSELLTLRCEFHSEASERPTIVDFSSGFDTRFPAAESVAFERLIAALRDANKPEIVEMLPARDRRFVNDSVLTAFLREASETLGSSQISRPLYALNTFTNGMMDQKVAAILADQTENVRMLAKFRFGKLIGFEILDPRVQGYTNGLTEESIFTEVAQGFMDDWFKNRSDAEGWLDASLRNQTVFQELSRLKESILGVDGEYKSTSTLVMNSTSPPSPPQVEALIDYGVAKSALILEFKLTAFGARIVGITTKEAFIKTNSKD